MKVINPHLFVYGTLLSAKNNYGSYLQQHCRLVGAGTFNGLLYDMGEYPGAIPSSNTGDMVYGNIYLMDEPEKILEFIDDYEGFGAEQEQPNLFVRKEVMIDAEGGSVLCWIYLYNLPVEGFEKIVSGRYAG